MKIIVIAGSVRPGSKTRQAANIIVENIKQRGGDPFLVDPRNIMTPHLGGEFPTEVRKDLYDQVKNSSGVVLCTPEYNGTFSSVLMALLENLGYPLAISDKPVCLLGVASGKIGAIKALEHLRSVCAHSGALVLPRSLSIAQVDKVFDDQGVCLDLQIKEQMHQFTNQLFRYLQEPVFRPQ